MTCRVTEKAKTLDFESMTWGPFGVKSTKNHGVELFKVTESIRIFTYNTLLPGKENTKTKGRQLPVLRR